MSSTKTKTKKKTLAKTIRQERIAQAKAYRAIEYRLAGQEPDGICLGDAVTDAALHAEATASELLHDWISTDLSDEERLVIIVEIAETMLGNMKFTLEEVRSEAKAWVRDRAPSLVTLRKLAAGGTNAVREHLDKTCVAKIDLRTGEIRRGEEAN